MPAPLARGLIFSISLLIAAGIAVYDNPQVREWLDDSRRKVALALHNLGDDIHPRPSLSRSHSSNDASTREDDSPEAVERRQRARQDILERARLLEERRRAKASAAGRGSSFDELVDTDGKLHEKSEGGVTTAAETANGDEGLRKRNTEAAGAARGAAMADPFGDEMGMSFTDEKTAEPLQMAQESRESTTTLTGDEPASGLLIDTDAASTHPSELLVDLTPTTSAAPSRFHDQAHDDASDADSGIGSGSEIREVSAPTSNYQAVYEWTESSNASFYSPPESEASGLEVDARSNATSDAPSLVGSVDHMSEPDGMSEVGEAASTPGSWTEVGSVVSEEDA